MHKEKIVEKHTFEILIPEKIEFNYPIEKKTDASAEFSRVRINYILLESYKSFCQRVVRF